jgi:hypothetical protein
MKVNFSFSFASLSLRFCKLYLENILMKHLKPKRKECALVESKTVKIQILRIENKGM